MTSRAGVETEAFEFVAGPGQASAEMAPGPARTFIAQTASDSLRSTGAKIGLAWIGVIAFCAVFAPLLANSFPLVAKMDGRWSSPLARHLNWADVTLLVTFFSGLVLLALRRMSKRVRIWLWAGLIALTGVLSGLLLNPPQNIVYQEYRDAARAGRLQYALYTPIPYSASDRLRDQPEMSLHPPSRLHWMGTEVDAADVLSRMIHACRIALAIGLIATGLAVLIGVFIGGLMGYFVGWVDLLGMRVIEIFEAIPTLFLMITIVAFFSGESYRLYLLMVVIGVTGWTGYARFLRAEFLRLRNQDFVLAAKAAGLPLRSILFRHMLPNGITPIVVSASFGIASAIVSEATLSFLNLGLIDEPSWGQMLSQGIGQGGNFLWWMALYPGLAIFVTVLAYNLVGEGLTDALDPRRKKA